MNTEVLVGVLQRAVAKGATAADGYLIEERAFSASVRLGEIETVTHSRDARLSLRVFAGRASAAASTSDLSRASLERVVDEATSLAKVTAEDPHAGLPAPDELIGGVPDLDLEDASPSLPPRRRSSSRGGARPPLSRATRGSPTPRAPSIPTAAPGTSTPRHTAPRRAPPP